MPRPHANPADVDRLVKYEVDLAARAVTKALRAVEQTHTVRSRRVARHLAGVLRMLQDTGRVTSPYDVVEGPTPVPVAPPAAPPTLPASAVEAPDND
jgi:hypothetical protein